MDVNTNRAEVIEYYRTAGGTMPYTIMGYELNSRGEWIEYIP